MEANQAKQAKHFLASRTLWVHILTLVLAFAATAQGDAWISEHPGWMQFLVYFSAFMGVVLRMLTDKPITAKTGGDSNRSGPKLAMMWLLVGACLLCASPAFAQRRGDPFYLAKPPVFDGKDFDSHDALDEVNAARRSWGLRPFARDRGLTLGALHFVKWRADRLQRGHTPCDFTALPVGTCADLSGCGAPAPLFGWYCCCTEDYARYAGAAWCWGRDGRRYQQIFLRR